MALTRRDDGIPLAFCSCPGFSSMASVVLDSIVAGDTEPPVLSIEMVNPISEQRPLALALLIIAEGMLVVALHKYAGLAAGLCAVHRSDMGAASNLPYSQSPEILSGNLAATLFAIDQGAGRDYASAQCGDAAAAGVSTGWEYTRIVRVRR